MNVRLRIQPRSEERVRVGGDDLPVEQAKRHE
jgi:hypothetical protein